MSLDEATTEPDAGSCVDSSAEIEIEIEIEELPRLSPSRALDFSSWFAPVSSPLFPVEQLAEVVAPVGLAVGLVFAVLLALILALRVTWRHAALTLRAAFSSAEAQEQRGAHPPSFESLATSEPFVRPSPNILLLRLLLPIIPPTTIRLSLSHPLPLGLADDMPFWAYVTELDIIALHFSSQVKVDDWQQALHYIPSCDPSNSRALPVSR